MIEEPNCSIRNCKHLIGVKGQTGERNELPVCKAFPDGIPDEIAYGENKHVMPYQGDHGIQYEKAKD